MLGEKTKIALVVVSYFMVSISMVFMNKYLLSPSTSIPAPLFITWYSFALASHEQVSVRDHGVHLLAPRESRKECE